MVVTACNTTFQPGEFVSVVATLGNASPVNNPPGSTVGTAS